MTTTKRGLDLVMDPSLNKSTAFTEAERQALGLVGLADLLCSALVAEGMALQAAQAQVYMFDVHGLLQSERTDLVDFQMPWAHKHAPTSDFVAAINSVILSPPEPAGSPIPCLSGLPPRSPIRFQPNNANRGCCIRCDRTFWTPRSRQGAGSRNWSSI